MRVRPIPVLLCLLVAMPAARPVGAQSSQAARETSTWNDERTLALVRAATDRRSLQLADTGLRDYTARANGYITFLAQLGTDFPAPPALIKSDQLALEVYWGAPNRSKQRIVGRRDTLLLPTDQSYHRDHLGIIQNNFPETIRLGDGDEVRDVPHPLSPLGLVTYDFRVADSLSIRTATQAIDVIMINVRPKDDRAAAAVGAVYVDRQSASVVRMTFSFTRAALIDEQLHDVSIILENGLVDGRFWLPRRQEIEIRRSVSWMDFPVRSIIRGRWEICCITTNTSLPPQTFVGPEISEVPLREQRAYPFEGEILDSLPEEVRALDAEEVRAVQEEARRLVREGALSRARGVTLSARSISDFVRFNRVEGLALGAGASQQLPWGFAVAGAARYGLDDEAWKGSGQLAWRNARGFALNYSRFDDFAQAGDVAEGSGVRNSIASQEFGSDWTNPFSARGHSVRYEHARGTLSRMFLEYSELSERPLAVNAAPAWGAFEPTLAADALERHVFTVGLDQRFRASARKFVRLTFRFTDSWVSPVGTGTTFEVERGSLDYETRRVSRAGSSAFVMRTIAAGVQRTDASTLPSAAAPLQDHVFFGGPVSGPGYDFHSLAGRVGISQRIEWQARIPFIPMALGRFGRVPSTLTLAPYVHGVWIDRPIRGDAGWHPAIGLAAIGLFDLMRIDVARGLRGGTWTFSLDVAREFWPVL
jgi:hypothetical protein